MSARGKIITMRVLPPIPDRQFDWCAYHDGEEETGHHGYGTTAQEAFADLARLDQECAEALEEAENLDSDYAEQQGGY